MARTSRLLTLLQVLRAKTRPVTAAALAAELGVSSRTIYRDIAELAAQGVPVDGEAGLGYILRPGLFLPPMMLSDEETEALVLGLRYVGQRGDDALAKAAWDALAKIGAVLNPTQRDTLQAPISLPGPAWWGFPPNVVDFALLRRAIRGQHKLALTYVDAAGNATQRVVWPLALGFMNEARILLAWCETRQDYRHFRTDRMQAAAETGDRFPGNRAELLRRWHVMMEEAERMCATDRN